MRNREVARILQEIADILEIKDENPFRIRAYQRASRTVDSLGEDVAEIANRGELERLPGIGKDLAAKISEVLESGRLRYLEDLHQEVPPGLLEILRIPGLGPKTAKRLFEELQVQSVDQLERLARQSRLRDLPGIQAKTEENILRGIALLREGTERLPLGLVLPVAREIVHTLRETAPLAFISVAGSVRRMRETVRDLDILVVTQKPGKVMEAFIRRPGVRDILAKGETRTSVRLEDNLQVDIRVVDRECFGSALCYFTGSKAHNIRMRERALKKGLKLNEYGVFRGKKRIAGRTEEEVYRAVGLPYIEPELREDQGEIEAAQEGRLPDLLREEDIRGDFHVHSRFSDGEASLEDIVAAAASRGLEWVGVCDHSKSLRIGRGLSVKALREKIEAVRDVNSRQRDVVLLCGAEVDILADGGLDYPNEVLRELDIVIAGVHSGFRQDERKMTDRITEALKNPHVNILAHPTGRMIGERDPYLVDMEKVFEAARRAGKAMEINAYPRRLDLGDNLARRAKQKGLLMAIGTDAHRVEQMDYLELGVGVGRRAWLEPAHVLNTYPRQRLLAFLEEMRQ